MKLPSKKKFAISTFIIVTLGLVTIVGVLLAVGIAHRPKVTVSADDLAQMKTLVHKYLNERNRMLVSSDPDSNAMLNVPMLEPGEISQQLAARQRDDIEKIRALTKTVENQGCYYWNRFDTKVRIEKTTVAPDKTVARIYECTSLYFTPQNTGPGSECSSFDAERDFTFVRNGAKWIISDVKVTNPGTMPPPNEPSVQPKIPSPKDYVPLNTGPPKK